MDRVVTSKQLMVYLRLDAAFHADSRTSPVGSLETSIHPPHRDITNLEDKDHSSNTTGSSNDMALVALPETSRSPKVDGTGADKTTMEDALDNASTGALSRRIYIVGDRNVGRLVAHSLAGIPNRPSITFLFRHQHTINQWYKVGKSIKIIQHGVAERSTGFDEELVLPDDQETTSHLRMQSTIYNLIVSVKAPATVEALATIAHRLGKGSTVLFIDNGIGILDELNQKLFTDPETRPGYMLGVSTHRMRRLSLFSTTLYDTGTIGLGMVPRQGFGFSEQTSPKLSPSARYLLRTMTRTPSLAAMGLTASDIYQLQLERLARHAVIDALTVIFDCKMGGLLDNFGITRVMRLLISEISLVIRSLPELQGIPNLDLRFAPSKLESQVVGLAKTTAAHESSMLLDVKHGRITGIDYSTGYIVRRGEELGIRCVMNYMLMQMVKGKQNMESKKLEGHLPTENSELPLVEK